MSPKSTGKQNSLIFPLFAYVLLLVPFTGLAQESANSPSLSPVLLVYSQNGMVSTQEPEAGKIGLHILKNGGNAVDAAVAIGFALAVTHPQAGNLGGGGFMMVHRADTGKTVAIDYREQAPARATRDLFLDDQGEVSQDKSLFSYLSVGVPGTVAGLSLALKQYGTLPLKEVIAPAIRLAKNGITVSRPLAANLAEYRKNLRRWPESNKIFFKGDESDYHAGDVLVQKDLARSLAQIAESGPDVFYRGGIAGKIVSDMEKNGGLITLDDLSRYQPVIRQPVVGSYRGYEIASMPPPSSGGTHLLQILNILEGYPIAKLGHNSAETLHLMAEAMKLAYADRSRHLGDPDFWKVPVSGLTAKAYAAALRNEIDPHRARPSGEIKPGDPVPFESRETTHFSVMDAAGNAVSNTYTLNYNFGTGIVAAGTGILLNNEMDDFSSKPGVPNFYGLIGGEANAIEPGKRPLSSMSPTLLFKNGKPFLATGSIGGSRIITSTLQLIMNLVDHGMDIAQATQALRVHHQWLPDELRVEKGLDSAILQSLRDKGHLVVEKDPMGSTQSIKHTQEGFTGASDSRRPGALTVGY